MNLARLTSLTLVIVALTACATPAGTPMPKPTDYAEVTRDSEIFKRYSGIFSSDPDVTSVFLTSNNNPRQMVVHVKDHAAHDRLLKKYGGTIEGLDTAYKIDNEVNPGDDPIMAVPKIETPTTWWEKVIALFAAWRNRVTGPAATPEPSPAPTPQPTPVPLPSSSQGAIRQI